ncbi:DUF4133 domain-containing protein [Staphylococcus epidermidis]|jgi:hypothetical protein|uniref:DUF4133 domain-containing protein n=1 Tax=Staphylococcus epidermidis TaxID=1282 RepID=A0A8I0W9S9_STAEP|nr:MULTISPECIES: DUF4133 domain-containing protein [Staphylococcus]EAE5893669.1 DUF4133 domain-containing protein [Listeria monocytogenes]ECO2926393.1 DUF4133 domain-containing protein [Campylobacter jejuni]MBT2889002.1 DUF4133 domain-containing protein [Streptomyces sp. McG2]MDU2119650.1 DUF4133 domain-containing protein [Staphylococcus aureus]MDU2539511.1 DUF4133 domain-containing protein [Streptococcus mitis]HCB4374944.1 DUF4133 domain-containing protein [Salmonella enterica]
MADENPNQYTVTKGVDSTINFKGILSIQSIMWFAGIVFIGFIITDQLQITGLLQLIIILGHVVLALLLVSTRVSHPDRRTIYVIMHLLFKEDTHKYQSIDINKYRRLRDRDR